MTLMKKSSTVCRRFGRMIIMAAVAVAMSIGLSSCYVDVGWDPAPPNGWNNTFYDSRLTGYWELYSINNRYVSGDAVNYLYFNGDGRGRYYYMERGMRYWENTAYWCQDSYGSTYQVNLQYQTSGSPTTMSYWFSDGTRYLTMQWYDNYTGSMMTYVYNWYPYGAPW